MNAKKICCGSLDIVGGGLGIASSVCLASVVGAPIGVALGVAAIAFSIVNSFIRWFW